MGGEEFATRERNWQQEDNEAKPVQDEVEVKTVGVFASQDFGINIFFPRWPAFPSSTLFLSLKPALLRVDPPRMLIQCLVTSSN